MLNITDKDGIKVDSLAHFDEIEKFHYFFVNAQGWITTSPKRTFAQCVSRMEKEKGSYAIFYVPAHYESNYQISGFAPQVNGAVMIGNFNIT